MAGRSGQATGRILLSIVSFSMVSYPQIGLVGIRRYEQRIRVGQVNA